MTYWTNADLQNVIAYYAGKTDQFSKLVAASLTELLIYRRQLGVNKPVEPVAGLTISSKPLEPTEKKG